MLPALLVRVGNRLRGWKTWALKQGFKMINSQETSRNTASPNILVLPSLLGEHDAAKYLGISPSTLRKLNIPRRVLGARRLYDRRDLDAFVDELPYEGEAENMDEAEEWLSNHV